MKLHLLGIFNSVHDRDHSHCAFTDKCLRFPKMMQAQGYEVVEYSNAGSVSEAKEKVVVLEQHEFTDLMRQYDEEVPDGGANTASTLFREFDARLEGPLKERVEPNDIVCHPFGFVHARLGAEIPNCFHVETGVGYLNTAFEYKIFESYAWWHYHQGLERRAGRNYEWVIPMSYDLEEWLPKEQHGEYILYFGRIVADKGLEIVKDIAQRTDRQVIVCGAGDPRPFLDDTLSNLIYKLPVTGFERSELLRNAYCTLMPTLYTEPFGSSGVEGMLCGTPLIASDFGGFSETVWHGVTGFRCKTLGDWLYAIDEAQKLDRTRIADYARQKHSLEACGQLYARVFDQISELQGEGFYSLKPTMAVPPR